MTGILGDIINVIGGIGIGFGIGWFTFFIPKREIVLAQEACFREGYLKGRTDVLNSKEQDASKGLENGPMSLDGLSQEELNQLANIQQTQQNELHTRVR